MLSTVRHIHTHTHKHFFLATVELIKGSFSSKAVEINAHISKPLVVMMIHPIENVSFNSMIQNWQFKNITREREIWIKRRIMSQSQTSFKKIIIIIYFSFGFNWNESKPFSNDELTIDRNEQNSYCFFLFFGIQSNHIFNGPLVM